MNRQCNQSWKINADDGMNFCLIFFETFFLITLKFDLEFLIKKIPGLVVKFDMPDVWILPSGKLRNIESDPIENEIFDASQPILKIVFGRTGQSSLKFEEDFSAFSELLELSRRSFTKMWKSEVNLRSNEAKDETRII